MTNVYSLLFFIREPATRVREPWRRLWVRTEKDCDDDDDDEVESTREAKIVSRTWDPLPTDNSFFCPWFSTLLLLGAWAY